ALPNSLLFTFFSVESGQVSGPAAGPGGSGNQDRAPEDLVVLPARSLQREVLRLHPAVRVGRAGGKGVLSVGERRNLEPEERPGVRVVVGLESGLRPRTAVDAHLDPIQGGAVAPCYAEDRVDPFVVPGHPGNRELRTLT